MSNYDELQSNVLCIESEKDKREAFQRSVGSKKYVTIIAQDFYQKSGLSLEAMGLISYLMSLPDDWIIYNSHLQKVFRTGRDRLRKIMKELKQNGYMQRIPVKNNKGRIVTWRTQYSDFPEFLRLVQVTEKPSSGNPPPENPCPENPPPGSPGPGKQPLQKNNNTKEPLNKNNNNNQERKINVGKSTNFNKGHEAPTDSVVVLMKKLQHLAISSVLAKSWLKKHGAAYILEKVDLMESQKPRSPEGFLNKAIVQDWKLALAKEPENKKGPIEPSYPSHDENLAWYESLSDADKLSYLQMALFKHPAFEEHLKYQKLSVLDTDFNGHGLFGMLMSLIGRAE